MRLGIFGGTFNPVHYGHVRAAEELRNSMALDRILFIPSGNPPLKSADLADAADRFAMTTLAVADNPACIVSDIELVSERKSFTIDTVRKLLHDHPHDQLFLILGIDAFLDMPNWYQPAELTAAIDLLVMTRPGFSAQQIGMSPFLDGPIPDRHLTWQLRGGKTVTCIPVTPSAISSTQIRRLVRDGLDITHLVPPAVAAYIARQRLYLP